MGAVEVQGVDHEARIRVSEKLGFQMFAIAMFGSMVGGALTMLAAFLATQ